MRFRFSLRVGLVVMTCLAGWLAYETHLARLRRAAIAVVNEVEGSITPPKSVAPDWIIDRIGPEYFCRIERVDGLYRKMSDEHLAVLSQLPELKQIATNREWGGSMIVTFSISNAGHMHDPPLVTDAGLTHVSKLRDLESLILFNTAVTDDGIAELTTLRRIQYLKISSTDITDESVPHLSQLKSLRRMWTSGTSITPSGVKRLQEALPNCEIVYGDEEDGPFYAL